MNYQTGNEHKINLTVRLSTIRVNNMMINDDNAFFNFEGAWELEKKKVRADAINNFVINAITEFQKFDKEHGYPTLGDISIILSDVAEELKEQNNG